MAADHLHNLCYLHNSGARNHMQTLHILMYSDISHCWCPDVYYIQLEVDYKCSIYLVYMQKDWCKRNDNSIYANSFLLT